MFELLPYDPKSLCVLVPPADGRNFVLSVVLSSTLHKAAIYTATWMISQKYTLHLTKKNKFQNDETWNLVKETMKASGENHESFILCIHFEVWRFIPL